MKRTIKRTMLTALLLAVFCLTLCSPVYAAGAQRFIDAAGLVSDADAAVLSAELDEISQRQQFDVVIFTTYSLGGWSATDAAISLYEQYDYGYGSEKDGVILLISMEERDWDITAKGFGETALNDDARDYLADLVVPELSAGNYAYAFQVFAQECDALVTQAREGHPYKTPFDPLTSLLVALGVGGVGGGASVGTMKAKLRSVSRRTEATEYMDQGSLQVTKAGERFLYHTVTRTAKPKNTGSGGRSVSHGGGYSSTSGKF